MSVHWLDIVILGVMLLSMLTGIIRGFVKELIALVIWVLAISLAYHFSPVLDPYLRGWMSDQRFRFIAGFIAIMLSVLIVGGIANALLSMLMKKSGLSGTDRILGMGFGFARGVFIVSLGLVVFHMTSLSKEEQLKDSKMLVAFSPAVDWMSSKVPAIIDKLKQFDVDVPEPSLALSPIEGIQATTLAPKKM